MIAPTVQGYGDHGGETFQHYYERWPSELRNFPQCVVENWVHRHWSDFNNYWNRGRIENFAFTLGRFDNLQIMDIRHVDDWLETLDYWGDDLFESKQRQSTWLAKYMLTSGCAPAPIIISTNSLGVEHPKEGVPMQAVQLIEGHMRLAYLRGMIRHNHLPLAAVHDVWLLTLPIHDWGDRSLNEGDC